MVKRAHRDDATADCATLLSLLWPPSFALLLFLIGTALQSSTLTLLGVIGLPLTCLVSLLAYCVKYEHFCF
jgi:Zn-dependent membrane protease YugP